MAFIKIFTIVAIMCVVRAEYEHEQEQEQDHHHHPIGYSYAKFSGPVSGPAKEVHTYDEHHGKSVDYVAKPDYHFEYGVEDPKSQVSQFRKESREDDAVKGEYSYTDPEGHVRLVKYTADKLHGFQVEMYIDGKHVDQNGGHQTKQSVVSHQKNPESGENSDYDNGDYSSSQEY